LFATAQTFGQLTRHLVHPKSWATDMSSPIQKTRSVTVPQAAMLPATTAARRAILGIGPIARREVPPEQQILLFHSYAET
jgi:hypothetical protein